MFMSVEVLRARREMYSEVDTLNHNSQVYRKQGQHKFAVLNKTQGKLLLELLSGDQAFLVDTIQRVYSVTNTDAYSLDVIPNPPDDYCDRSSGMCNYCYKADISAEFLQDGRCIHPDLLAPGSGVPDLFVPDGSQYLHCNYCNTDVPIEEL